MMARTQISLDRELLRQAQARARELGVSLAEYVRQLLTRDLAGSGSVAEPSQVFNLGRSSGSDVSREKDRMLGEALSDESERPR